MPYNNSSCNNSYSQPSYPSYSHPYVHHQNPHQYNGSYGQSYAPPSYGYPALSYPGYSQSYSAPRYASPSYGTPNVFSIIKTSPNDTDDNVCALNSYDTLCLETGSPDHLTITGDKANKKITFALKNVVTSVAGNETPSTGHVLAPLAKRTSGVFALPGGGTSTSVGTGAILGPCVIEDLMTGALATRVLFSPTGTGTAIANTTLTVVVINASFSITSDDPNDTREFAYLLLN